MNAQLEQISAMQADTKWLRSNLLSLRVRYKGQYVAVKDRAIVESHENLKRLIAALKANGIDPGSVLIEFVTARPVRLIFRRE